MWSAFSSPNSKEKTNFFLPVIALKDCTKIVHQKNNSFFIESSSKSGVQNLPTLNIDSYLAKIKGKTKAPQQTIVQQNKYLNASAQNLFINKIEQTTYSLSLIGEEEHAQFMENNDLWGIGKGKQLEKKIGRSIFAAAKAPNKKRIAFLAANNKESWPQADWNLYVTNNDFTQIKKITDNTGKKGEISFYWSPDGQKLFYHQQDAIGNYTLFSVDADGKNNKVITKGGNCKASKISPNGKKIAFLMSAEEESSYYNLWVMNIDATQVRLLVKNISPELLIWSPDSQKIAFVKNLSDKENFYQKAKLGVVQVENKQANILWTEFAYSENQLEDSWFNQNAPLWLNNNKKLLFTQTKPAENGYPVQEIFIFNLENGEKTSFVAKKNVTLPLASQGGKNIFYIERKQAEYTIWLSDSKSMNTKALAKGQSENFSYSIAPDGKKIVFISNDNIWTMNISNNGLTKLLDSKAIDLLPNSKNKLKNIQWSADGSKLLCLLESYHPDFLEGKQPYVCLSLILYLGTK